jgi:hypothetical protein
MVTAPAKRELVRWMRTRELTERRSLAIAGMSASSLRYQPRPDHNQELREQIVSLAQRHRRYGALKIRQSGQIVNHKRVERLNTLQNLQVRRGGRKKIPLADRQPLVHPGTANEVWSIDFVFDHIASGRTLKCLAVVDDGTHESVAVVADTRWVAIT